MTNTKTLLKGNQLVLTLNTLPDYKILLDLKGVSYGAISKGTGNLITREYAYMILNGVVTPSKKVEDALKQYFKRLLEEEK